MRHSSSDTSDRCEACPCGSREQGSTTRNLPYTGKTSRLSYQVDSCFRSGPTYRNDGVDADTYNHVQIFSDCRNMIDYDKHTLNKNFTWREKTGPLRRVNELQAKQWNEQGFFLLENVIGPEIIDRLAREIDPLEEKAEAFLRTQEDQRFHIARADEITFTTHVVKQSTFVKEFLKSGLFVDLCLDLIGDDTRLYWDQAVYKKPDTPQEFPWHQDNGYNFVLPQDYLTCWIPVTDTTRENGCPWVAPGVHKVGTLHHWWTELGFECLKDVKDALPVEAKAGDIVIFSSLTPHRTGPNLTDTVRKAYIAQYAHDGSTMFPREGRQNIKQNNAERQFLITKGGRPVPSPGVQDRQDDCVTSSSPFPSG